jgi:outer membrane protein assembly factor BamE
MPFSISKRLLTLLIISCLLAGCGRFKFPGVFKIDVAQGNIVEAPQVAQLKVGMTQNQVIYLLGSPMIQDPFHQQRWDYYYYLSQSGNHPTTHHVILYFSESRLARIEGSAPQRIETVEQPKSKAKTDPVKDLAPI